MKEFSDPLSPPFLYGSHYSNVGVVLHWLLRVAPFADYGMRLQGGRLDHPDRLLHSIAESWRHCRQSNSDFKELVPEMFYLPEALRNGAGLDLGTRQDGQRVDDVVLPPWASTPEEFVQQHREALESECALLETHTHTRAYTHTHTTRWVTRPRAPAPGMCLKPSTSG